MTVFYSAPVPIGRIRCLAVAVLLLLAPLEATADGDLPSGKFALLLGGRQPVGAFGKEYSWGLLGGVEAGYQPTQEDKRWSFGVMWSILWGRIWAQDATVSAGTLRVTELNFGLKVRRLLSERKPLFLGATVGISLLRTNLLIPPQQHRQNTGPYMGLGWEYYLAGKYLVGLEARFGMYPLRRPRAVTYLASIAFGL